MITNSELIVDCEQDEKYVYIINFKEKNGSISSSIMLNVDELGKKKLLGFSKNGEDMEFKSKDGLYIKMFTEQDDNFLEHTMEDVMQNVYKASFVIEIGSTITNFQMSFPLFFKYKIMQALYDLIYTATE